MKGIRLSAQVTRLGPGSYRTQASKTALDLSGRDCLGPAELHSEDFCTALSFWAPPLLFWNWRWQWIFCEWEIKFCQLIVVSDTCKHLLSTHYVLGIAAIFIGHCSRLQNELHFSTHPWIHVLCIHVPCDVTLLFLPSKDGAHFPALGPGLDLWHGLVNTTMEVM